MVDSEKDCGGREKKKVVTGGERGNWRMETGGGEKGKEEKKKEKRKKKKECGAEFVRFLAGRIISVYNYTVTSITTSYTYSLSIFISDNFTELYGNTHLNGNAH